MPLFGYNDDNGNPSEPYNLQWGLDRRRAAPAAPAQQGGNSPEVERALAVARHQVQLEKERQAQVQADEIQKRIQAGILRERAERAKARQAQAAKKKQQQQNNQQPQTQTQQPQTQTQQPQTQTQQPQTQTQQPQTQSQAPANQQSQAPATQPQTQPQAQPSTTDYSQMAPDRGDWNPYTQWAEAQRTSPANQQSQAPATQPQTQPQAQAPTEQEFDPRDFFGPVGTSPMNSGLSEGDRRLRDLQERDRRMQDLGPQNGDVNLLGWLWNKITGPSPEDYASQSTSVPSETWRYENPADLVNPPTPDGRPPEPGAVNRFFGDVGTALQNKRDWFTAPPAEPDSRRDFFGPVGTSPMNGAPGADPDAPYGPLPPERKGLYNPAERERLLKELQERDRYYQEYYDNMQRSGNADRNARLYPFLGAPQGGANGPDVEADPDMPVVVDTSPNMDPGMEAPGSAAPGTHPAPGVHQIPQEIPANEAPGLDVALQPGREEAPATPPAPAPIPTNVQQPFRQSVPVDIPVNQLTPEQKQQIVDDYYYNMRNFSIPPMPEGYQGSYQNWVYKQLTGMLAIQRAMTQARTGGMLPEEYTPEEVALWERVDKQFGGQ